MKTSLATIAARAYPRSKAEEERRNNPASYYFYRPVSWIPTWVSLQLGLKPTHVTLSALALSLLGLVLSGSGWFLVGVIALNAAYLLDQVDGNLARIKGEGSGRGAWLDSLVGFLYSSFSLSAIGLGLHAHADGGPTLLGLEKVASTKWALVLGLVGSGSIVTRKFAFLYAYQSNAGPGSVSSLTASRGLVRLAKAANSWALLASCVAVITHALDVWLVLFSVYHAGLALVSCLTLYRRLS